MDEARRKRGQTRMAPDCRNCIHNRECLNVRDGGFCTKFQSRQPEERQPDPNRQWETGDETTAL